MSSAQVPWTRKLKPLPLPGQFEDDPDATAVAPAPAANDATADADDELDRLTSQYAAEAAASTLAVQTKQEKRKQGQKSMAQLRSDGLSAALPADNKGFQLLQRMGWSHGQGLGAASMGQAAPIGLELKTKRTGLGIDEDRKRRLAQAQRERQEEAVKRLKAQQHDRAAFRESSAQRFSTVTAEKHIATARKTIETLDERASIARHYMWPPPPPQQPDAEAVAADEPAEEPEPHPWELLPAQQRLADVLQYLRDRHCYCLFCGAQYDDAEELAAICPGLTEDDH